MNNADSNKPVDWDRTANNGLRIALRGSAWLLATAGVVMQIASKQLDKLSKRFPPDTSEPGQ